MTLGQKRSRSSSNRGSPAAHLHPCGSRVLWPAVYMPVHCSGFGRSSCFVLRACRLVLRLYFASSVPCRSETQRKQRQQHPHRQRPS